MKKRQGIGVAVCVAGAIACNAATSEAQSTPSAVPLELVNELPERPIVLEARIVDEEQVRVRGGRERVETTLVTEPLCDVPCGASLLRPRVVRIAGEDVAASDWFTLDARASRLTVRPGSAPARTAGLVLGGIGILTTTVSVILTLVMLPSLASSTSVGSALVLPAIGLAANAALLIPGGLLYFGNATRITDDLGRRY
jgi:hypothetical protein